MYIPTGAAAYVFALVNMCGWGLWGNVLKSSPGKMRIQNFYWLYILGIVVLSVIVAFAAGGVTTDDPIYGDWSFVNDDFKASGKNVITAFFAGVVFNIANFGLTICINLIGLAIAFGVVIGMGFVTGTIFAKYIVPSYTIDNSNAGLMWGGIVLGGIATVGFAVINYIKEKDALEKKTLTEVHLEGHAGSEVIIDKVIVAQETDEKKWYIYVLCFASGLLMSFWGCIMGFAMYDPIHNIEGLSPFGQSFYFNIGLIASSIIMLPISLNFDLDGHGKTSIKGWFSDMKNDPWSGHFLSFAGGFIWSIGWMGFTFNHNSPTLTPAIAYSVGQCATLVAIISGICWGEFKGTTMKVKIMTGVDCAFFVGAIVLLICSKPAS